jgi:hypothetical protein
MKALIYAAFAAAVVAAPSFAFAQASNAPVTRAEVRADLIRVEQAGYNPSGDDINYPADIQAAEARIHATPGADHAYGGTSNDSAVGTSAPATPVQNPDQQ